MLSRHTARLLPALAAAIALTPLLATAATPEPTSRRIVVSDLNLSTPAGVDTLYARIHAAAEASCAPLREATTGSRIARGYDLCVRDAVSDTVRKVAIPGLSALHAARGTAGRHG